MIGSMALKILRIVYVSFIGWLNNQLHENVERACVYCGSESRFKMFCQQSNSSLWAALQACKAGGISSWLVLRFVITLRAID